MKIPTTTYQERRDDAIIIFHWYILRTTSSETWFDSKTRKHFNDSIAVAFPSENDKHSWRGQIQFAFHRMREEEKKCSD